MEKLNPFAQKVLDVLEPDREKQADLLRDEGLYPPSQAKCVVEMGKRLHKAIENKEKVMVAGDYDADGMLSTSILVDALRAAGVETGFYIPNRLKEGYGLSAKTVEMVKDKGYDLLITVDNGVRQHEALKRARELGLEVIVTDHHTIDEDVDCSLLVHPTKMEEEFFSLCGAALIYEVLRSAGLARPYHMQWAAVASITDCMVMKKETRALVKELMKLRPDQQEMHIAMLAKNAHMDEEVIGYQVGPKINALGRMAEMANANNFVRYMLNHDPGQMVRFVQSMELVNDARKEESARCSKLAMAKAKLYQPVIVVRDEGFHEGIIGLSASRMMHELKKPVILGKPTDEGVVCSMRSERDFNALDFLGGFDGYTKIGGHTGAAGFTVKNDRWEDFEKFVLTKALEKNWICPDKSAIDISPDDVSLANIDALAALRPFGQGFEAPLFRIDYPHIVSSFPLSGGTHMKYTLDNGLNCLYFNTPPAVKRHPVSEMLSMSGTLGINEWQKRRTPQFLIQEARFPVK